MGERDKRFFVVSNSPGLSAKVSFYGLCLYNKGLVRPCPYAPNGERTIDVLRVLRRLDVLRRLRAEIPNGKLIVVWDDATHITAPRRCGRPPHLPDPVTGADSRARWLR